MFDILQDFTEGTWSRQFAITKRALDIYGMNTRNWPPDLRAAVCGLKFSTHCTVYLCGRRLMGLFEDEGPTMKEIAYVKHQMDLLEETWYPAG
mgnify:CR=1 FL=1